MDKQISKTYRINAMPRKVWEALTTPEIIKRYFFGTEAESDWKEGSQILYRGVWEGKEYLDKGIILELVPEKLLTINHWSSRTGKADSPENYSPHSYQLSEVDGGTDLTMVQEDAFTSEENRAKAWQHWDVVIEGLKKVVE